VFLSVELKRGKLGRLNTTELCFWVGNCAVYGKRQSELNWEILRFAPENANGRRQSNLIFYFFFSSGFFSSGLGFSFFFPIGNYLSSYGSRSKQRASINPL
jgi:hypothetical protein